MKLFEEQPPAGFVLITGCFAIQDYDEVLFNHLGSAVDPNSSQRA